MDQSRHRKPCKATFARAKVRAVGNNCPMGSPAELALDRPAEAPGLSLPVPLLTAANVLVWVQVSLELARSLS